MTAAFLRFPSHLIDALRRPISVTNMPWFARRLAYRYCQSPWSSGLHVMHSSSGWLITDVAHGQSSCRRRTLARAATHRMWPAPHRSRVRDRDHHRGDQMSHISLPQTAVEAPR